MKIKSTKAEKIETQMAPMIDVVFQLLIFFMLTLKIVEPEGDFSINMPLGKPTENTEDIPLQPLRVKLEANPNGDLTGVYFGSSSLGVGEEAFARLNNEILKATGSAGEAAKDQEVEIEAAYNLRYEYGIAAIGACTGRMQDGKLVRYIEKIKFTKVKNPDE